MLSPAVGRLAPRRWSPAQTGVRGAMGRPPSAGPTAAISEAEMMEDEPLSELPPSPLSLARAARALEG